MSYSGRRRRIVLRAICCHWSSSRPHNWLSREWPPTQCSSVTVTRTISFDLCWLDHLILKLIVLLLLLPSLDLHHLPLQKSLTAHFVMHLLAFGINFLPHFVNLILVILFLTLLSTELYKLICPITITVIVRISESECKCLTCNQKPTGSQFSLLHEPN